MTRYDQNFDSTELEERDRIAPKIVIAHPERIGELPETDVHDEDVEDPRTLQFGGTTTVNRDSTVHHDILVDPENETLVRAARTDSEMAVSQKQKDWTVKEVGDTVVVEDVEILELPGGDEAEDEELYAEEWIQTVYGEILSGNFPGVEMEISGNVMSVSDYEGRNMQFTVSIE